MRAALLSFFPAHPILADAEAKITAAAILSFLQ